MQEDNNNLLITKLKVIEFCNLANNELKIAVLINSAIYKKTQKDNSRKLGKQYMNKMRNLTKR